LLYFRVHIPLLALAANVEILEEGWVCSRDILVVLWGSFPSPNSVLLLFRKNLLVTRFFHWMGRQWGLSFSGCSAFPLSRYKVMEFIKGIVEYLKNNIGY
jgi:hypothetical protein